MAEHPGGPAPLAGRPARARWCWSTSGPTRASTASGPCPIVEAWNQRPTPPTGSPIIGVHTPEFAFEHVVSNVHAAAQQLGVDYPIAIDNNYATWNAYENEYWPAEYLIDATGRCATSTSARVSTARPRRSSASSWWRPTPRSSCHRRPTCPTGPRPRQTTPESYLGSEHIDALDGQTMPRARWPPIALPSHHPPDAYAYGGTGTSAPRRRRRGRCHLQLQFQARNVYLVLGGSGTVGVTVNGIPPDDVGERGAPALPAGGGATTQNGLLTLSSARGSPPMTSPSADRPAPAFEPPPRRYARRHAPAHRPGPPPGLRPYPPVPTGPGRRRHLGGADPAEQGAGPRGAGRADRRGGGLHRRRRPRLPRLPGRDGQERGHVRPPGRLSTCTSPTGCTGA